MIRLLTRDYLDVVRCILLTGSSSSSAGQTQLEDDEMVDANSTTTAAQAACQVALIGDLGMGVLSNRALSRYLLEWYVIYRDTLVPDYPITFRLF